jgi:hypothetical protein
MAPRQMSGRFLMPILCCLEARGVGSAVGCVAGNDVLCCLEARGVGGAVGCVAGNDATMT